MKTVFATVLCSAFAQGYNPQTLQGGDQRVIFVPVPMQGTPGLPTPNGPNYLDNRQTPGLPTPHFGHGHNNSPSNYPHYRPMQQQSQNAYNYPYYRPRQHSPSQQLDTSMPAPPPPPPVLTFAPLAPKRKRQNWLKKKLRKLVGKNKTCKCICKVCPECCACHHQRSRVKY